MKIVNITAMILAIGAFLFITGCATTQSEDRKTNTSKERRKGCCIKCNGFIAYGRGRRKTLNGKQLSQSIKYGDFVWVNEVCF